MGAIFTVEVHGTIENILLQFVYMKWQENKKISKEKVESITKEVSQYTSNVVI